MTRRRLLARLGACLMMGAPALAAAPASASGLHVIPFPGTPDASPTTSVILSSLRPSDISSILVSGSSSGAHRGHWIVLPDGGGMAFVPDRAFTAGERVGVTARLSSARAGTASGAPGATRLSFSFTVAVAAPAGPAASGAAPAGAAASGAAPAGPAASGAAPALAAADRPPRGAMSFHSVGFHPPMVTMGSDPDRRSGDIFLTAKHAPHYHLTFQGGPMILDSQGRLVWFQPVHGVTTNLEVQHYRRRPVLTWWQTHATGGHGKKHGAQGQDVIMNRSYQTVAVLHAGNGYNADSHEFQLTPQGTALINAVAPVRADLSSVGGPRHGTAVDCIIQELDVKSGRVLWEWHALHHVPLNAAYIPYRSTRPYDFFHLNSIQQLPNHNLLISARHTWGVYEIDKKTGKVLWTLGGKYSNFKIGPAARFEWQHDAHLTGHTLSLFDDASNGAGQKEFESSAKVLRLNFSARTATLVHRYVHSPPLLTPSQGSAQILPDGNVFVDWGGQPDFSEYRPDGHQIFTGSFPFGAQSYRAYRFRWTAEPRTHPALAASPAPDGSVRLYASWNGATQVAAWRVLGELGKVIAVVGQHRRTGFETAIRPYSEPYYVAVQALGQGGRVLASSGFRANPDRLALFGPGAFVDAAGGSGQVPVGCFTAHSCHLTLQVSTNGAVLARSGPRTVAPGTGTLIPFSLSRAGRSKLNRAAHHRLAVQMTLRDGGVATITRRMTLVPYMVSGPGPSRSVSQSPAVRIVQTTGFVSSSTGAGRILAACYFASPCHIKTRVTAHGTEIARTAPEQLGVHELGDLRFTLNAAGQAMLRHARGNQLPAQITLQDGSQTASGQIALVSYR